MAALGDLFAPAFIRSDPNSVAAVEAWTARNAGVTPEMIEQTRAPVAGVNTGNPAGMVDPNALRALAQGGQYDVGARRNAIASQVQANQAAQAQARPSGANAWRDYWVKNYGADPNSPFFAGTEDWKGSFF
jgi:hypothetical protein